MKRFWKGLRVRTWIFFVLGGILALVSQLSKSRSAGVIGGIGLFIWFIGFIDMIFAHGGGGAVQSFEEKSQKYASHEIRNYETHERDDIPLYLNLYKHFHRLLEIEKALGEISALLKNVSIKQNVCESIGDMHITGFLAYHLAQEGLSLLHILSANYAIAKKDKSYKQTDKLDSIMNHMREVEAILLETLHDMEPYKSLNKEEMVKAVLSRHAQQKGT